MTTRAGIVGILAGLLGAIIANILSMLNVPEVSILIVLAVLFFASVWVALFYSRSNHHYRNALLGALSVAISGTLVYLFWSASYIFSKTKPVGLSALIDSTLFSFLFLAVIAASMASIVGRIQYYIVMKKKEEIDLSDPQMGMNAAISAVVATLFNLILTILFYARLGEISLQPEVLKMPVFIAMFFLIVAQMSLTLVLPHEAKMAQHRSGLDEVKMAAFVSIATAPAVTAIFYWLSPQLMPIEEKGLILVFSWGLALISIWILFKKILPRRKTLPAPQSKEGQEKALLFGSIGASHPGRLVTLCIGCGIVIALPMCITLVSVGLNLAAAGYLGSSPFTQMLGQSRFNLNLWQILINGGLMLTLAALLSAIYLFYLFLGRRFGSTSEQG